MRTVLHKNRCVVESAPHFIQDLFALRAEIKNKKLWYRGHSQSAYQLTPSIGRESYYAGKRVSFSPKQERNLLHRFRRRTYLEAGRLLNAGEALFVARHHGLPTRLLDWTANALFGLYFSCYEHHQADAQLWALERFDDADGLDALALAACDTEEQLLAMLPGAAKPAPPGIKLIEPLYNSTRIRAQDGAFTVHAAPDIPLDHYGCQRRFKDTHLDVKCLYSWSIPHSHKRRLVEDLSGIGITHRTVFPDLDAIARSLWETETLWNGQPSS